MNEGHPHDCAGVWTNGKKHGIVTAESQVLVADVFPDLAQDADVPTGAAALHHFEQPHYNIRFTPEDRPLVRKLSDTKEEREFYHYSKLYVRHVPTGEDKKWYIDRIRNALQDSSSWAGMAEHWVVVAGEPGDDGYTCVVDIAQESGAYVQRGSPYSRMHLPEYAFLEPARGGNYPSTIIHEEGHESCAGCDMAHKNPDKYVGIFEYGSQRKVYIEKPDARKITRWFDALAGSYPRVLVSC